MPSKKVNWPYTWLFQRRKALAKVRHRGDALRDARKFEAAADRYAEYLLLVPGDFDIWVQRGNCLKDAGDYASAHTAYGKALSLRSDNADLHLQLGHLYKLQGNLAKAFASYETSAMISPTDDAWKEIDYVDGLMKQVELAEKDLQSVKSLPEGSRTGNMPNDVPSIRQQEPDSSTLQGESGDERPAPRVDTRVVVLTSSMAQADKILRQDALQSRLAHVRVTISRQALPTHGN